MEGVTLIQASAADIPTISALADKIWNQYYPAIIGTEQINYMLGKSYNSESLTEQMLEKKHQFFLVLNSGVVVGFISVNCVVGDEWFLNKFYIDQQKAAKGIGSKAFAKIVQLIKPSKISLTVNRQNFKAINFYFKNGFRISEVADFDIGDGYFMNDFVMERKGW